MPLFATLLIYLDADWRREWDAETLFLDAPTGTGVFVRPRGGRAVVMDQDITHRISTPSQVCVCVCACVSVSCGACSSLLFFDICFQILGYPSTPACESIGGPF